jgi:low temperature requirement protein LtrA
MPFGASTNFLRIQHGHEHSRVTFVELFFDLVFVFAVTQLSHTLLEHLTILGLAQTLILFLAVWWAWIDTAWTTNWLDPQRTPVRVMLFALMLAGLILSTSIEGDARFALWATGMFIDCLAPPIGFHVSGFGRSTIADWDVEGSHMAERCGLFIIIALGESILVMGATFSKSPWTAATAAAFLAAFVGSVAMWWIYFNIGAEKASRTISISADPGRLARLAYTYLHLPIVAGIIVSAVADDLVLGHPAGRTDAKTAFAVGGGPALYLLGNILFKRTIWGRLPLSHLVGLGLLVLLAPAAMFAPPLALGAAATLVLVIVAAWETRSLRSQQPGS